MIEGGQGARSRVIRSRLQLPVSIRTRFSMAVERPGPAGKGVARRRLPNPRIARLPGLSRMAPVPVAVILRSVAERPVSLSYHHFSPTVVSELPAIPADNPSITQLFRSVGILDFIRHDTYVSARFPGETEAVQLRCGAANRC
ncbi:UTRA domain-containing protein [Mycoplana ramosa]|uniref:UTRA domain-containing protein n=1 Tax=Mycoplana ramosa TaxID=40837 RepID=A0ABW3Z1E7_MYCRA